MGWSSVITETDTVNVASNQHANKTEKIILTHSVLEVFAANAEVRDNQWERKKNYERVTFKEVKYTWGIPSEIWKSYEWDTFKKVKYTREVANGEARCL